MKAKIFRLVAVMSAAFVWLGVPAMIHAENTAMTVTIPFEFYVGGTKLPSGVYTLKTESSTGSAVRVFDENGHQSVVLPTRSRNRASKLNASLVFNKYEGAHFLAEVRWMGATDADVLPRSAMESQIAKNIAAKQMALTNR